MFFFQIYRVATVSYLVDGGDGNHLLRDKSFNRTTGEFSSRLVSYPAVRSLFSDFQAK